MVKSIKIENAYNIETMMVLVIILPFCVGLDDIWKPPTASDMQRAIEICHPTKQSILSSQDYLVMDGDNDKTRCIATILKLWTDKEGFNTKRFVKLLKKHHKPVEISVVVDYCNRKHRQLNLSKWAEEAYKCFAKGRMGKWINEYVKNVYKKKTTLIV